MYRASILDEVKYFFKNKSALSQLIIINIIVFLVVNIIKLFYWLFQIKSSFFILQLFAVPSDLHSLLFKPWTLFTYMFLHENFFHLFFNMIVLYFAGKIFSEYLSNRKLINTYILGGIAGALFYIISYNIFPIFKDVVVFSVALGASASILAVLVAIASYVPNYSVNLIFVGPVKLKYIAIIVVVLDILSISKGNPGGHLAHLGGALWGFFYIYKLKKGKDISVIIDYLKKFFNNFINYFKYKQKNKFKAKHEYSKGKERPLSDEEYNKRKAEKQKKIDTILDKISKSGYDSISEKEKKLLFKMSDKK
jgi:membrane associated rhomboid family serine protease